MVTTTDQPARLRTAIKLINLGETGLDSYIKVAMDALNSRDVRDQYSHYVEQALMHLRNTDPTWTSVWVATRVADGIPYADDRWLSFATEIPENTVKANLHRLESEDLKSSYIDGMISVVVLQADTRLAAHIFTKLCELQGKVDAERGQRDEFVRSIMWQLKRVFLRLPDDTAAGGILSSATSDKCIEIKVAVELLSRINRPDVESLHVTNEDTKKRLRAFLKGSVNLVLQQDDFDGEVKANLASAIAQVGNPGDMEVLMKLIQADISRMRRGRAARANGDRGPLSNGSRMMVAGRHIAAVMHLDPTGAEQVLINLLSEPEYCVHVAAAMAREFTPKRENLFDRGVRYELIWSARDNHTPLTSEALRRTRFAEALNFEIKSLREQTKNIESSIKLKGLANALAVIDSRRSAAVILDEIGSPDNGNEYTCLESAEQLLMAGVELPSSTIFALVDSVLERTKVFMANSDIHLIYHVLALCSFVDQPSLGIAKIRDVVDQRPLRHRHLRELITAVGESRSDAAVDFLFKLACDVQTFQQYAESFINAFVALDTPRSRELLLGFVDPNIHCIQLPHHTHCEDILVARLGELAQRYPDVATRLRELCEHDLPEINRHILSMVICWLGTPNDLTANLNLIDDAKATPVPQGVLDQINFVFVKQQFHRYYPNILARYGQASKELRTRLFRMIPEDGNRRKSAFMLLGKIEKWRLGYHQSTYYPRHPDLTSNLPWPPMNQ